MEKKNSVDPVDEFDIVDKREVDTPVMRDDSSPLEKLDLTKNNTIIIKQEKKKKKYDGSLLGLFKSEYFNVHLLITHLLRSKNEGAKDYLVNELYTKPLEDIDFYMPQLCYMAMTDKASKSLVKFIFDMTPKYSNLGLKAMLYITSYSHDEGSPMLDKASELSNVIETVIVNNEVPAKYRTKTLEEEEIKDPAKYLDKINRDKYKNQQLEFLERMKHMSLSLKNKQLEDRDAYLKAKIRNLNRWIITELRNWEVTSASDYEVKFHGIIIPLYEGDDSDPGIMVNFVPELARWFNTKQRCPINIVVETINLSEANEKKEELSQISEDAYKYFENKNNNKAAAHNKNAFDINPLHKQKSALNGDVDPAEDLVIDNDDCIKRGVTEFDEEFKSPFSDEDENEKDMDSPDKNYIDKDTGHDPYDSKFKSIGKFAKFIELEEHMFADDSEDEGALEERESICSTIYNYEYGQGFKARKRKLIKREYEKRYKQRSRSLTDTVARSRLPAIPSNIKRLREDIWRTNGRKESSTRLHLASQSIALEHRPSDLFDSKENSARSRPHREEDAKHQLSEGEDNVEAYLEGMKNPFGKDWKKIEAETKAKSLYRNFKSYKLRTLIFKSNDDLRQELLAIQLIKRLKKIFEEANLSLYLHPYEIIITSHSSGYMECIPNSISIDALKKKFPQGKDWTFAYFFEQMFYERYEECQKNFVQSLAGYSFLCYLFNIKDRHNGNILLDSDGHLIHIDFGFMFSNAPGGINFESSPFKFTQDYMDVMGGVDSQMYEYFKSLLTQAFFTVRKHLPDIISMIEIMYKDSIFPCFKGGRSIFDEIEKRWSPRFNIGENQQNEFQELVDRIIANSLDSWRTKQYDIFQKWTNNIER